MAGSIVGRVALGAALTACVSALVVATTTTIVASLALQRAEDRRLEEAAVTFADELAKEGVSLEAIHRVQHDEAREVGHTGMVLAVYDQSGALVSGEPFAELPTTTGCTTVGSNPVRVCRASSSNGLVAVVGGAHSQPLPLLAGSAFVATLLAVALAWAVSRPVSRRVVAPLTRLRERIEQLDVDSLTPSTLGADEHIAEVDALRLTISQLITRVDRALAQAHRFAANAAHELRTPLTTVLAELELLTETVDAVTRDNVLVARTQLVELSALLERLLILAVPTHRAAHDHEVVSLRDLTEDAAHALPQEQQTRLRLPRGDALVRGDSVLLAAMVTNAISNGLKFGQTVTLEVARAGTDAVIAIEDDGPGVEPSERELVFEPFFRSRTALSQRLPGHGLGLALIRHVAEAHGGTAALVDKPSPGVRLEIRLPAI